MHPQFFKGHWLSPPFPYKQKQVLQNTFCRLLLPKIFWPIVRKDCSTDREKLLKFEAEGQEFAEFLSSLDRTIYSNSEKSEQFLVTECFLEVSQISKNRTL